MISSHLLNLPSKLPLTHSGEASGGWWCAIMQLILNESGLKGMIQALRTPGPGLGRSKSVRNSMPQIRTPVDNSNNKLNDSYSGSSPSPSHTPLPIGMRQIRPPRHPLSRLPPDEHKHRLYFYAYLFIHLIIYKPLRVRRSTKKNMSPTQWISLQSINIWNSFLNNLNFILVVVCFIV